MTDISFVNIGGNTPGRNGLEYYALEEQFQGHNRSESASMLLLVTRGTSAVP